MSIDELEAEALKLTPQARAKLAGKLLESLEGLSEQENQHLWADEAQRRDRALDAAPADARNAADVFRDARAKIKQMSRASFHPLAEQELVDAARCYEVESPGLGGKCLDVAERCERAIGEYPAAGAVVRASIRRRLLDTLIAPYGGQWMRC